MKEYPENMQEFIDNFSTDEQCRDYIQTVRWSSGFVCPSCAHTNAWLHARHIFRCMNCRRDVSVTAGTVFGDSRVPLRLWFQALWCMVSQKNGVSAMGLGGSVGY